VNRTATESGLTPEQMERVHRAALAILADPGMRLMEEGLLKALDRAGASVDFQKEEARFPAELVEETLAAIRKDRDAGVTFPVLNGVVSSFTDGTLAAKFGGACCSYYDWESRSTREPTRADVVAMLRLGDAIPEVRHVGNPVICMQEDDGAAIPPHLRPIKTSALVARHTSRPYTCEVWSVEGLEFQIEIGCVVRGGWEAFRADPVFITAKETISPLQLPREDAQVLMALATKGLPCTIIPMPLSGASSPVTPAANVAMATAEILGVFTALRAFAPEARVAGGVISGVMGMTGAGALFATPGAILQDRLLSQHFAERYGLDLGIGTGYIDAARPGAQSAAEKTAKMLAAYLAGKTNYPVGILEGGKTFSPAEAMLELEIARVLHRAFGGATVDDDALAVDVMRRAGIGGNVLADEHTVSHFREVLHLSGLFRPGDADGAPDRADRLWQDLVATAEPYTLPEDKAEEIDRIVERAEDFFKEKER